MRWLALLTVLVVHIVGLAVFLKGFFPSKVVLPGYATFQDAHSPFSVKGSPQFSNMVLMVVDAMRADFMFSETDLDMKFLHLLISDGSAVPFTAFLNPPTVTLPRLKGITTGGTPSFLDAILNVADDQDNSQGLSAQDSWIRQFRYKDNGKRIRFYGDDTWLKLFPAEEFFTETDGTNSFFVSDFTEVDNNVTRHLDSALDFKAKPDWDALILHYLGLDHIGHKGGPKSVFMKEKQKEMDGILRRVYDATSIDENTLIILMGDHGMNEVGNHGGSSAGETNAGLVFISPKFKKLNLGLVSPLETSSDYSYYRKIQQIDMIPTIAALLDFPIPKNSLGVFIKEILGLWNPDQQLKILLENENQIRKLVEGKYKLNFDQDNEQDQGVDELYAQWVDALRLKKINDIYTFLYGAQSRLASSATNYDMDSIWHGLFLLVVALFVSLVLYIKYFVFQTLADKFFSWGFLGFIGLYSTNFFASSFIEEEHQLWWFFLTIFVAALFYFNLYRSKRSFLIILTCIRIIRAFSNTGQKFKTPYTLSAFFLENPSVLWILNLITFTILSILSFCQGGFVNTFSLANFSFSERNPNDIGPLLSFIATFVTASLSFLFKLCQHSIDGNTIPSWLTLHMKWTVESFGVNPDTASKLQLLGVLVQMSRLFVYSELLLVVLRIVIGKYRKITVGMYTDICNIITIFLVHQTRAEQIPVYLVFLLIRFLFAKIIEDNEKRLASNMDQFILVVSSFTLALQQVSFFSVGNTNLLATVDLSNAYNGISSYNVYVVGVLTFVSNFTGPIFWSLTSFGWLLEHRILAFKAKKTTDLSQNRSLALRVYKTKFLVTLTFYATSAVALVGSCINLRYHLFIWTVFSPKLLFFGAWSLLINGLVDFVFLGILLMI